MLFQFYEKIKKEKEGYDSEFPKKTRDYYGVGLIVILATPSTWTTAAFALMLVM